MDRQALTQHEALALLVIQQHVDRHGYQPSVREVAAAMGYRSPSSAHRHLRALESKGYVARRGSRPRALDLR